LLETIPSSVLLYSVITDMYFTDMPGSKTSLCIGLDGIIRVFDSRELVAVHIRRDLAAGWATCPEYHARLWAEAAPVEARPLSVYEEVSC